MSWSRRLSIGLAALLLCSCGFHLRGQANYHFESIYVNAPGALAFAVELRKALENAGSAKLADDPQKAQVILDIPPLIDDKDVLSLSPGGRVREFALQKRVQIRLHDKEGNDWLPTDEIVIRRTYLYDDTERLARQIQENRLLKEMQTEAVQQIVRRLQAARNPAG
ncbi:MAG TPA: LPS assembly lipoprotein LptE [Casimicrobiaceae bacterium]